MCCMCGGGRGEEAGARLQAGSLRAGVPALPGEGACHSPLAMRPFTWDVSHCGLPRPTSD